ncbi:MAG TPA: beta-ketoacyl synthase N-terminal-like domain-containing protein [Streptosporangiaceae bacterium]|nr:beta-ketoacyl synthase N-terminal-like domain-containing protein [Streptosporangiaceae bacterium]
MAEDPREAVVLTGIGAASAFGRGTGPLFGHVSAGTPAFAEVTRFDVAQRRVRTAAHAPGSPDLAAELAAVVEDACTVAGLEPGLRARCPLLLAAHTDRDPARTPAGAAGLGQDRLSPPGDAPPGLAAAVAQWCGLLAGPRVYTAACVAASTAVADAATMIASGRLDRAVVAAGYLVEPGNFALFDAGRALAKDGQVRPFSAGRQGMLLGDGVAAVVLESASAARGRGADVLARLAGWGRCGDAYHVCQPRPDGAGLANAVGSALRRAAVAPAEVGYVNANGTGTAQSDAAEAAALLRVFGETAGRVPVSSTKSVHGHALEASALLELVVTVLALGNGLLPVNAGFLEPDPGFELDLVLGAPREARPEYALSVNFAFGGANTALLVGAA